MRILTLALLFLMAQTLMAQANNSCSPATTTAFAVRLPHEINLDAQHPAPDWAKAVPVTFCADWQGHNADPARQTEVRLLWTPATLYLRFVCRYRELFVFDDSDPNGRRDHLWDRDVAEAFLQPDPSRPRYYKEFEVSPNGMWIDLDIVLGTNKDNPANLKSGLQRSAWLDREHHTWAAEIAIPMKSLTPSFDPKSTWRANFFRVEGQTEPRFYSAWQPTNTPQPNFHVPEAFGKLVFVEK